MHEKLIAAERPLLIADERLDGDSLGSSLAVAGYLLNLGKPVKIFLAQPVPEKYCFLPHLDCTFCELEKLDFSNFDVVATFDCSDEKFINQIIDLLPGPRPLILNFDHHATNPKFGHLHFVDTKAPATCEVVHRFFKENQIEITKEMATCLFYGLVFDTTAFSNSATSPAAFSSASELMLAGARGNEAIKMILKNRSVSALRLWGIALERLWFHEEFQAVATCITNDDLTNFQVTDEDIDGLSNFLHGVLSHNTVCVMRETIDGGVKFSLRTRTGDVGSIARANGGGGHAQAAGFTIKNSHLVCLADGRWEILEKN